MMPTIKSSLNRVREACAAPAKLAAALDGISDGAHAIVKNAQCNGIKLDEVFGGKKPVQ